MSAAAAVSSHLLGKQTAEEPASCSNLAARRYHCLTLSCGVYVLETDSLVVQATVQDLKDCGFDCWETSIGGPGVQQHSPLSVKEDILEILRQY